MNTNRDASQRLNFEFSQISIKDYSKLTKNIVSEFNLKPDGELVHGLDETFQDYKLGDLLIGLEWDIWSGYIVVAKDANSEPIAKEIAQFINTKT